MIEWSSHLINEIGVLIMSDLQADAIYCHATGDDISDVALPLFTKIMRGKDLF